MTIVRLNPAFAASQWKREFAERVIALCPGLNPDAVDEISDAEHKRNSSLSPMSAADGYAAGLVSRPAGPSPDEVPQDEPGLHTGGRSGSGSARR